MKPLSARLLNEQTPVLFILKSIAEVPMSDTPVVVVREAGFEDDYVGNVQFLEKEKTLTHYSAMVEAFDKYKALSEEEKKTAVTVPPPSVEISRASHDEFPFMR